LPIESDQVAVAARRVALEVAVQGAVLLRDHEFVLRQGEVVHADVDVAGVRQLLDGEAEQREPCLGRRQVGGIQLPLCLEHLRQVRVRVHGEAVGLGREHRVECLGETLEVLLRQPVDQVDAHRVEAELARLADQPQRVRNGLDAVHRLLHQRVEVLDAEAATVESDVGEVAQRVARDGTRVELDRVLASRVA
jgi:hypothetical protein